MNDWIGERVRDPALRDAYLELADLASWSDWQAFDDRIDWVPREPGVYLFRLPDDQRIVHAGMAGERAAAGRPQGLRGRLAAYLSGHDAVGGFGEAALDRALADQAWVAGQAARGPRRARRWAADAIVRLGVEVSWAERPERADAQHLLEQVRAALRPHGLWA